MPKVQRRRRNAQYVKFLLSQEAQEEERQAKGECNRKDMGLVAEGDATASVILNMQAPKPATLDPMENTPADPVRKMAVSPTMSCCDQVSEPPSFLRELIGGLIPAPDEPAVGAWDVDDSQEAELLSEEVPVAESAWDYPFSQSEKQMRLMMLLDKERIAAREEVWMLMNQPCVGRSCSELRCPSPGSSRCSSRGRSPERDFVREDSENVDENAGVPPVGVDYPFSKSEKQLLLTRLMTKELEAAEMEARLLRELNPRAPQAQQNAILGCRGP